MLSAPRLSFTPKHTLLVFLEYDTSIMSISTSHWPNLRDLEKSSPPAEGLDLAYRQHTALAKCTSNTPYISFQWLELISENSFDCIVSYISDDGDRRIWFIRRRRLDKYSLDEEFRAVECANGKC